MSQDQDQHQIPSSVYVLERFNTIGPEYERMAEALREEYDEAKADGNEFLRGVLAMQIALVHHGYRATSAVVEAVSGDDFPESDIRRAIVEVGLTIVEGLLDASRTASVAVALGSVLGAEGDILS